MATSFERAARPDQQPGFVDERRPSESRERPTVSVEDAAIVRGVPRGTAYAAVRDGTIPSLRIGRRVLVPTARLVEMLEVRRPDIAADSEKLALRGIRHSGATLLIAMGISPKLVQQRLGHAHVSITLALYSHVLPGHDQAAVESLAAVVDKTSVTNL